MKFHATALEGAYLIEQTPFRDNRGSFSRTFCAQEFESHGLETRFVQTNLSVSEKKDTLRGFHFQVEGAEEVKLIQCVKGALLDVIVDFRPDSPGYLQHLMVELSASNRRMLYVPRGFAHAFITLEDETAALYQVSNFYTPGKEMGLRWDDPALSIHWPCSAPILSDKDASWPLL